MARMNVLVDDSVLAPWEVLEEFAEVERLPGRQIQAADVRDCDALIVRSISQVNADLLEGSRVRLVGTATSGVDHIDVDYLQTHGIQLVSAPGSNANAVAEYCISALAHLDDKLEREAMIGVIGAGATGSRFIDKVRALGFRVCFYDPLLSRQVRSRIERTGAAPSDLPQLLKSSDVISVHVPLTRAGPYPTAHLLSQAAFDLIRPNGVLINTSRGEVIDVGALQPRLVGNSPLRCVFDVWEHEPEIDGSLLSETVIGTPHIAGYSVEAKSAAGQAMIEGVASFAGVEVQSDGCIEPGSGMSTLDREISSWRDAVMAALPLSALSETFRFRLNRESPISVFDGLRRVQASRREYRHYSIRPSVDDASRIQQLQQLGFQVMPGNW